MKKLSREVEQIMMDRFGKNTVIAGVNFGYFGKKENHVTTEKLKNVFTEWIDKGHNNFSN